MDIHHRSSYHRNLVRDFSAKVSIVLRCGFKIMLVKLAMLYCPYQCDQVQKIILWNSSYFENDTLCSEWQRHTGKKEILVLLNQKSNLRPADY